VWWNVRTVRLALGICLGVMTAGTGQAQTIVVPRAQLPTPEAIPSPSPTPRAPFGVDRARRPDTAPTPDPRCGRLTDAQRRTTPGCQ
jgi:hypothetical protein